MTSACEHHEASLSALVDGELPEPELLATVDHLAECDSCRGFYRRARVLAEALSPGPASRTAGRPAGGPVAPAAAPAAAPTADVGLERIWRRIAAEHAHRRRAHTLGRVIHWAPRLAAVLGLALGLWWLQATVLGPPTAPGTSAPTTEDGSAADDRYIEVDLEGRRGSMTDARFVQLTTEVLQADRRYQLKMLEVMNRVAAIRPEPEGSGESPWRAAERSTNRISLGEDEGTGETFALGQGSFL